MFLPPLVFFVKSLLLLFIPSISFLNNCRISSLCFLSSATSLACASRASTFCSFSSSIRSLRASTSSFCPPSMSLAAAPAALTFSRASASTRSCCSFKLASSCSCRASLRAFRRSASSYLSLHSVLSSDSADSCLLQDGGSRDLSLKPLSNRPTSLSRRSNCSLN